MMSFFRADTTMRIGFSAAPAPPRPPGPRCGPAAAPPVDPGLAAVRGSTENMLAPLLLAICERSVMVDRS